MTHEDVPAQQANDVNEPRPPVDEPLTGEAADGTVTADDTGEAADDAAGVPPAFPDQPQEARGEEPLDHA